MTRVTAPVAIGFYARTGWTVMVAITRRGHGYHVVRRDDLDLTQGHAPDQIFHAAAGLDPRAAEAFVGRSIDAVRTVTGEAVARLCDEIGASSVGVVIGDRPVPESVSRILASHPLMHAAEGELYREALVDAAERAGRTPVAVPRSLIDSRLREPELADTIRALGVQVGVPWRKDHKRAAAVAILAVSPR